MMEGMLADMQQHYNHIASQNKAQNVAIRKEWLASHTPEEIYRANIARIGLSQRTTRARPRKIKDDRIVKRPRNVFAFFVTERHASGDFKGIKIPESAVLIGREFKGLTDSEKKVSLWKISRLQGLRFANTGHQ